MNPDANSQNHFNLPPPVAEAQPMAVEAALPSVERSLAAAPESAGSRPSGPPSSSQTQDDTNDAGQSLPALSQSTLQAAIPTLAQPAPLAAAASDAVLDKEWVLKAKQIVAQTINDPYTQNDQLAQVKAGYLQKRYGKVVKLVD